jgi:hypothetical protein
MPIRKRQVLEQSQPKKTLIRPRRKLVLKKKPKLVMQTSVPSEELEREQDIAAILRDIASEIHQITDVELRRQYEQALDEVGKDGDLEHLINLSRYKRSVVPLDEFLFGGTYLGLDQEEIYPGVLEVLEAVETEQYVEAVMKGAIGGGKTTAANLSMARQIYKLSCMRNPQQTFGIQQHSSIVFTIQSVRLTTAKKAVFEEFGKFISNSPYFKEVFPYDRKITSEMKFMKHNVSILPVSSSDTGAISLNVIGGLLDEVNFMQKVSNSKNASADEGGGYDQAKALYLTLSKRRRSRFLHRGKLPGTLFLVSSSRYPDDFTELKAAESVMEGGDDPEIYVFSKSLWESKGRSRYSEKEFRVLVGNERTRSRILGDNEEVEDSEDTSILHVPEDFRKEFEKDIDGCVRDFGGMTTLASHPFIQNREKLFTCMSLADQYAYQSVIPLEEIDLDVSLPSVLKERIRDDVHTMRVCHADLAVTRDSAGLAIGHIAGTKTIERRDPDTGKTSVEVLPVIAYDLILRIMPPRDGEIDFSKIRQIIYNLRDNYGLPIKVVTTDGFQSVDFRQTLAKKGFVTEYLSMDRTTQPYKTLRDAFYDGRILLPRHQTLIKELTELEYVRKGTKEKVDHKPRGSKDVADAVCGVASYLLTRRSAWSTQPTFRGESGLMLHGGRTGIGTVELEELSADEMPLIGGRRSVTTRKTSRRVNPRRTKNP